MEEKIESQIQCFQKEKHMFYFQRQNEKIGKWKNEVKKIDWGNAKSGKNGKVRYRMEWNGMEWYGMVWNGMVWYGMKNEKWKYGKMEKMENMKKWKHGKMEK